MINTTHFHTGSFLPGLRAYLRRSLARHTLTEQERANLAASRPHAAVFSASVGAHPHW